MLSVSQSAKAAAISLCEPFRRIDGQRRFSSIHWCPQMSVNINWKEIAQNKEIAKNFKDFITKQLNSVDFPDYLGPIIIEALQLDSNSPHVSICDVMEPFDIFVNNSHEKSFLNSNSHDELEDLLNFQIILHAKYRGKPSCDLSSEFHLNKPVVDFATLPVEIKLKELSFDFKIAVAYISKIVYISVLGTQNEERQNFSLSIDFETSIGDKNNEMLHDTEKVQTFVTDLVKRWITRTLTYPNFIKFAI